MTIEELRDLYLQEMRQYNDGESSECDYIYPNDYSDWLEQKLIQPCPECEKIRKMLLRTYSCDVGKFTHVLTAEWNKILRWAYREASNDPAK